MGIFSNDPVKTSSTSVQSVPQWVTDAQQSLQGYGQSMLGPFSALNPNYRVAGLNQDQTVGFDLSRGMAQQNFTQSPSMPSWYGAQPQTAAPAMGQAANGYQAAYANATGYNPTNATAAQITGSDIQKQLNPYIQSVVDPAVAQLRRTSNENAAQIGARAAASGSFGGSREAIQRGQNTRALGEQTSALTSQLMSSGYDKAAQLAGQNANMWQQASLQNAGAANTAGQFGANAQNNASVANQNSFNQMNQFNAGAQNSRDQFLASLGQQGQSLDVQRRGQDLTASGLSNTFANDEQARQMKAIQLLLANGTIQQNQLQKTLDVPLASLAALQGITPQQIPITTNTNGTQPDTSPTLIQQLLGGGLAIGGKIAGSDRGSSAILGAFGL